jgi:hypothetical protein
MNLLEIVLSVSLVGMSLFSFWQDRKLKDVISRLEMRDKTNDFFREQILWQQKTIDILRSEFVNADGTPIKTGGV